MASVLRVGICSTCAASIDLEQLVYCRVMTTSFALILGMGRIKQWAAWAN